MSDPELFTKEQPVNRSLSANPTMKHGRTRANALSGSDWTRFSISIWSDIKKSPKELALKHPAMFPAMLVDRLIRCFASADDRVVLDPFSGSGSTVVAAAYLGKRAVGFELSPQYIELTKSRLEQKSFLSSDSVLMDKLDYELHQADARDISKILKKATVDLVITSPPYWDILNQKRTADYKSVRHYGNYENDLGTIHDYEKFLDALQQVFFEVWQVLRSGKYCIVNVMDLRKQATFYPYHIDTISRLNKIGFQLDDIIIWDRRAEYNNLRALGYPFVFRLNKTHEYLLIFKKP